MIDDLAKVSSQNSTTMSPFFTFIVDPIQGQSYRRGELLSIINSHVATVTHARKETVSARQSNRKKKPPELTFPNLKRHWSAEDASMLSV